MDISKAIIETLSFTELVDKYDLSFIPDYCSEMYSGQLYVFEEDTYFNSIDFDSIFYNDTVKSSVLFLKNLHVDGLLIQEETDFGPLIIVKGNVTAKNIYLGGGFIYFRNDVKTEQSLVGSYNHGNIDIAGDIEAELILSIDHSFSFHHEKVKKGFIITDIHDDSSKYAVEDLLKSKYYSTFDQYVKVEALLKSIKNGESLLKTSNPPTRFGGRIEKFEKSKSKKMDLSYINIKEIPQEILNIEGIEDLDISSNYIDTLSESVLKLNNLRKINLCSCEFSTFPDILLSLPNLKDINIGENGISNLPSNISKLSTLKNLNLYNCNFMEFPSSLYSLNNLEELDIAYQEEQPPFIIDKPLNGLKMLNLHANFGSTITVGQPALRSLNMRNCSLKEIPKGVLQSVNLKTLDISSNDIKAFPDELKELKKLEYFTFNLEAIGLSSIRLLKELPNLKKIGIQGDNKDKLMEILQLTTWTELYVEAYLEDMYIVKEILERPNLNKLVKVDYTSGIEIMSIEEGRRVLGIKL